MHSICEIHEPASVHLRQREIAVRNLRYLRHLHEVNKIQRK